MADKKDKVYVKVRVLTDLTGAMMPEEIIWEGDRRYRIDRVSDVMRERADLVYFTVHLGQETRRLYRETLPVQTSQALFRWYMEVGRG